MRDADLQGLVMDLRAIRCVVENDIERYRYEVFEGSIGNPLGPAKVAAELSIMRAALVSPYWIDVELRDTFEQVAADQGPLRRCAIVADDGAGTLLAYDPVDDEFLLVRKFGQQLRSFGVNGGAVGCFMAR